MRTRLPALVAPAAWAGLALAVVLLLPDQVALRTAAALPMVMYWPGYAFLRAIGHRCRPALEWHAIAVVVSLAAVLPGGFLLNWLDLLGRTGWICWLSGTTLFLVAIAACRPDLARATARPIRLRPLAMMGFLLAAGLVAAAAAIAIDDGLHWREFRFTEFWMVPDHPVQPSRVVVGARNAEGRPMVYAIQIMQNGMPVASWHDIVLETGAEATRVLPLSIGGGQPTRLEAWLFESGSPGTVYRKVWLNVWPMNR